MNAAGYTFERVGTHAQVNGHDLAPGASYATTQLFGLNPWTIHTFEVKNLGPVRECDLRGYAAGDAGLVTYGSDGSEVSFVKGLVVTLILVAIYWSVRPR